jgi:aminoglycoside 6'-N-acetyltransferase I
MRVREVTAADRPEWLRMRIALWPDSLADHDADTKRFFEARDERNRTFVAEDEGGTIVGFLELGERSYAPGCASSPVPYIEGWFVDAEARRRGAGAALVRAAERYAQDAGFTEIASDVEIDNAVSLRAHEALGYEETDRVVSFRRSLP